ncbi:MAG TPA: hypothetical protein VLE89_06015 [Chlamydiales bacterium]|nr:hypothetical protein [Chlamydiales bacterium]
MSVPKVPPFQIVGDRLKFYNVDFSIAEATGFWRTGNRIRILSKTITPDEAVRIDLLLKTAQDTVTCAEVLQTKLVCSNFQGSAYTSHFEISPDRIQRIRVPTETFYLEINPEQIDQIHEIAEKTRVVTSNHDTASAELNEKIHGKKREDVRQLHSLISSDPQYPGRFSIIGILNRMKEGNGEYLTPQELETLNNLPLVDQLGEVPEPCEQMVFSMDPQGQLIAVPINSSHL